MHRGKHLFFEPVASQGLMLSTFFFVLKCKDVISGIKAGAHHFFLMEIEEFPQEIEIF